VTVTVRLFAALRDAAGTAQVEVPADTVAAIVAGLCDRFGEPFTSRVTVASGMLDGSRVALDDDVDVPDGAELALLPPFSGGSAVSATGRRNHLLLLGGSLLVPALLALGAVAGRWVLGLATLVVAVVSIVDLHSALGATSVRTVLPATIVLGTVPVLLLTVTPDTSVVWTGAALAVAVMLTFLLSFASPRRHEAAAVVGSTLYAGLIVGVGGASLVALYDMLGTVPTVGTLALIGLTDAAVITASSPSAGDRARYRLIIAVAAALIGATVMYGLGIPDPPAPALTVGLGFAAVFAALLGARLRHVLRVDGAEAPSAGALLFDTTDAVLLGAPLVVLWLQMLAT
jgi:molybdopterin synthase sulfur carrier subunit